MSEQDMQKRLSEATALREQGRALQDQSVLEEARRQLLVLDEAYPGQPEITYQAAIVHDNLGMEHEAIPFYIQTLAGRLEGQDSATGLMKRERTFLGLGSTYRCLGEYQKAEETLRQGLSEYPQSRPLQIFLALTLYNLQQHREAMELVMTNLLETTSDPSLEYYKRGLLFYTQHIDESW